MAAGLDWESRWSEEGKARTPPQLSAIVNKHAQNPDVIGMHGGLPPASAFPFNAMSYSLTSGGSVDIGSAKAVTAAQQYNLNVKGYAPLVDWARALTEEHQRPAQPVDVVMAPGSTAALDAVLSLLLNPGDALLVERYTYSHVLDGQFTPRRYHLLPVDMDEQGLVPSDLRRVLHTAQQSGGPMPRVLYLIPTGQNPTGAVMGQERMAEIYEIACEFDLVVVEDDAYYWLSWPNGERDLPGLDLSGHFLSVDTRGRVIRLDTLAKLLGPGFRLGWVSGAPALVSKLALALNAGCIGPNSLSQVVIHSLVQQWGRSGFEAFVRGLQANYASQAALADAAAQRHLGGVARWTPARAGMFLWVELTGIADADAVLAAAAEQQVVVVPGKFFDARRAAPRHAAHPTGGSSSGGRPGSSTDGTGSSGDRADGSSGYCCPFFRVSFASLPPAQIDEGFRRLRVAIDSCCGSAAADATADTAAIASADAAAGATAHAVPAGTAGSEASDEVDAVVSIAPPAAKQPLASAVGGECKGMYTAPSAAANGAAQ